MFYNYRVNYFDSYEDKEVLSEGLVYGHSYTDAIDKVLQDYGTDSLIDIYLHEIYVDGACITKEEIADAFK